MPQKKDARGRFTAVERKQLISARLPAAVRDKLRSLPNTNKYIEAILCREMAVDAAIPDPDWDYISEWDLLLELLILAGNALQKISQHEERNAEADEVWLLLRQEVGKWLDE